RAGLASRSHVRVRRAALQDAGLVEDRDRHGGCTGVELADVGDGALVLGCLAGVGRRLAGIPCALRRRGVVERDVLDLVLAHLVACLLNGELFALDDVLGLWTVGWIKRQARIDRERAALGLAPTAAAATRGDAGGQRGQCA